MHEFTLKKPTEEMEAEELRSTMDEFMDKHAENVEAFSEVQEERDEFSEKVESLEEDVSEYTETAEMLRAKFAEIVSDGTPLLDADELAERFSLDELIEKADSYGAFSIPTQDDDEEASDDEGSTFSDKPEKAPVPESSKTEFRDQAENDLRSILGDF